MIVLDEQLDDPDLAREIERWYKGKVANIKTARPFTQVLDDDVPMLLLRFRQPTFITINYWDFWQKVRHNPRYCFLCIKLEARRYLEVPKIARQVFGLKLFDTKRKRMGKIISYREGQLEWYPKP